MYSVRDGQYTHYFAEEDDSVVYKHTIDTKHGEQITTSLSAEVLAEVRSEFGVERITNIDHIPHRR